MKTFLSLLVLLFIIGSQDLSAQQAAKDDTKTSTFQVGFFHPIGSHGKSSGEITNNISLNILSGYTGGLDGFELSFISSVMNGNMKGCQIAGASNIVTGTTQGIQIGMCSNVNLGKTNGLQLSGIANVVTDSTRAVQISGGANVVNDHFTGTQLAGIGNVVNGNVKGTTIAGAANVANGEMKGVQISGLFNYTKINQGLQLGFINVADSSSGVSIGFLSIIKHGYYNFSLFTDEMLMANLNYKMGTKKFYNILGVSLSQKMWGLTYGIGTHFLSEKKLSFNTDLSFTNMSYQKIFENQICLKTKLSIELNYRLTKRMDAFAGLSYNVFVSDKIIDTELQQYVNDKVIPSIQNKTFKSVAMQLWPGFSLGVKLRL